MEEDMSNATAMTAALFFLAGALLSQPLWREAQAEGAGTFRIAPQANTGNVWVLKTSTGQLRLCRAPVKFEGVPDCGLWME